MIIAHPVKRNTSDSKSEIQATSAVDQGQGNHAQQTAAFKKFVEGQCLI